MLSGYLNKCLNKKIEIMSLQYLQMFTLFWDHKDVMRIFKQMLEQKIEIISFIYVYKCLQMFAK